jgi:glycine cleavage system regulatory protein
MKTKVILSIVGSDRPGLTQAVAQAVLSAGGNWLESHLSRLAGKYVGSVLVELDRSSLPSLYEAVVAVDAAGLQVIIVPSGVDTPLSGNALLLEVVGNDRPGIVHEVTTALADLRVNVEDLSTCLENSSWSGGRLFRLSGRITLPEFVSVDVVRDALEDISGEIMVDLTRLSGKAAHGLEPA